MRVSISSFFFSDGPGPEGASLHDLEDLCVDGVLGGLVVLLGVLGLVVVEPAEDLAEAVLGEGLATGRPC